MKAYTLVIPPTCLMSEPYFFIDFQELQTPLRLLKAKVSACIAVLPGRQLRFALTYNHHGGTVAWLSR
jgi:hypothetical protein